MGVLKAGMRSQALAKILFVPVDGREIDQFGMVKPELEKLGAEVVSLARDSNMDDLLRRADFSPKRLKDYNTMNMLTIIDKETPDLLVTSLEGALPIPYALAVAAGYRGIPYLQIYNGMVYSPGERMKNAPFFRVVFRSLAKRILNTFIKGGRLRSVLCLLITLKATKNPTRFLREMPREMLKFALPAYLSRAYRDGFYIGVPGPYARDIYLAMGYPPERVLVTGQPRLDRVFCRDYNRDECLSRLGVSKNKELAVLATQPLAFYWNTKVRRAFLRAIYEALDQFPQEQLIIKVHPVEDIGQYRRILKDIGWHDVILLQDVDLHELLHACNLLMTTHSTVAMEAMLFHKPVLCIDFTSRSPTWLYTSEGAAIGVHRKEDLVPAMRNALYDPQTREELEQGRITFITKHIDRPDGQTSKRVAELIMQLIQESRDG